MKRILATLCLTALLINAEVCWSADFKKGLDAYNEGDYITALREWKAAALRDDVRAQTSLGFMYYGGKGVPQDYEIAGEWYMLAAKQGDVNAQTIIATMFQQGLGVKRDDKTALKWYGLAAAEGYTLAHWGLGCMYYYGQGVLKDDAQAYMWLSIAASSGHEQALNYTNHIAGLMTSPQLAAAKARASGCVVKNYKGC